MRIKVKVVPNASRNALAGFENDILKVRLQAPPVDGKANAALILFLAECFGLHKSSVSVVTGATGRLKLIDLEGLTPESFKAIVSRP